VAGAVTPGGKKKNLWNVPRLVENNGHAPAELNTNGVLGCVLGQRTAESYSQIKVFVFFSPFSGGGVVCGHGFFLGDPPLFNIGKKQ